MPIGEFERVYDSSFRFFPVEPDPALGWRLNFWDAATNKTLALFGRHEFRDYLDVLYLHANAALRQRQRRVAQYH
jgi:hypothetical protein